jgi:hypothetical protein
VISPSYRDLDEPEPEVVRERDDLDVEAEAPEPLSRKDLTRGVRSKRLEPALGVSDPRRGERPCDQVEEATAHVASPALADLEEAPVDCSRPDRDIGSRGERIFELLELFDGRRKVRVAEGDDSSRRGEHAPPDCRTLPSAPPTREDPAPPTERSKELRRHGRGSVRRSVVDDDDLERLGIEFLPRKAGEARVEAVVLVKMRNNDGDRTGLWCHHLFIHVNDSS